METLFLLECIETICVSNFPKCLFLKVDQFYFLHIDGTTGILCALSLSHENFTYVLKSCKQNKHKERYNVYMNILLLCLQWGHQIKKNPSHFLLDVWSEPS